MICYAMQYNTIFISHICLSCTLDYRSMGVHISKVRSLTLDDLDVEEYKLLMRLGELSATLSTAGKHLSFIALDFSFYRTH